MRLEYHTKTEIDNQIRSELLKLFKIVKLKHPIDILSTYFIIKDAENFNLEVFVKSLKIHNNEIMGIQVNTEYHQKTSGILVSVSILLQT